MDLTFNTELFHPRVPPFAHQLAGTRALIANPNFALFDEMGAGKTKQVIDAACYLHATGQLDTVVVVCPAGVKSVWLNPEFGELVKHMWTGLAGVLDLRRETERQLAGWLKGSEHLAWVVTSYEFIRNGGGGHLKALRAWLDGRERVMVVFDEAAFLKSHKAIQTKACFKLRRSCDRAVLLNGTPVANDNLDLYAPFAVLDKGILGYENFYHFRSHHAIMGGFKNKKVLRFLDVSQFDGASSFTRKTAPYVLRRLKEDCLDLPPKTYSHREVPLTDATWKLYREMRDDALTTLPSGEVSLAPQAIVKLLRLTQLTGGFLGGLLQDDGEVAHGDAILPEELSSEKTDAVRDEVTGWWRENPGLKVIVWCRFRAEIARLHRLLMAVNRRTFMLWGGMGKVDREESVALFSRPDRAGGLGAVLVAQPQAGGLGLNLVEATRVIYHSSDYSLITRLQSEDRCHRPGQRRSVTYLDVVATGPAGQRTVDHAILKAIRKKDDAARWTSARWRAELKGEL